MKTARSSEHGTGVTKRRNKALKDTDARTSKQRLSKRIKSRTTARKLAGSLHRYAKGRPDPSRVRQFVRQEVSRAAAQEG